MRLLILHCWGNESSTIDLRQPPGCSELQAALSASAGSAGRAVTPLQAVPTTVPRSVILAPQQTRSSGFRSLDWSPVIVVLGPDYRKVSLASPVVA